MVVYTEVQYRPNLFTTQYFTLNTMMNNNKRIMSLYGITAHCPIYGYQKLCAIWRDDGRLAKWAWLQAQFWNSHVAERINDLFNGCMTKNVKSGLGTWKVRPVYLAQLRCECKRACSLRIFQWHLHLNQLFTSSVHWQTYIYRPTYTRASIYHSRKHS